MGCERNGLLGSERSMPGVIHIHGDSDRVFPVKYIKNPILVSGGSHIMVITKHRWFNKNLPLILKNE